MIDLEKIKKTIDQHNYRKKALKHPCIIAIQIFHVMVSLLISAPLYWCPCFTKIPFSDRFLILVLIFAALLIILFYALINPWAKKALGIKSTIFFEHWRKPFLNTINKRKCITTLKDLKILDNNIDANIETLSKAKKQLNFRFENRNNFSFWKMVAASVFALYLVHWAGYWNAYYAKYGASFNAILELSILAFILSILLPLVFIWARYTFLYERNQRHLNDHIYYNEVLEDLIDILKKSKKKKK